MLSLALVAAALNVGASLLDHPTGITSALDVSRPLAPTLLLSLVVAAVLAGLARMSGHARPRRGRMVLAGGAAILLTLALVAPLLGALLGGVVETRRGAVWALGLALVALAGAAGALGSWREPSERTRRFWSGLAACSPLHAFLLLALFWSVSIGRAPATTLSALGLVVLVIGAARIGRLSSAATPATFASLMLATTLGLAVGPLLAQPEPVPLAGAPPADGPRCVVLLTIDTLRADRMEVYGSRAALTPALDALADDSITFLDARAAAPWTKPSFASLITGLSPLVHGTVRKNSRLPNRVTTLAEHLSAAGWPAVALGHNVFLESRFRFDQGFTDYRLPARGSLGTSAGAQLMRRFAEDSDPVAEPTTEMITTEALDWIEHHKDERFFLWVHWFDPHLPYAPTGDLLPRGDAPRRVGTSFSDPTDVRAGYFVPSREERRWIEQLYDGEVRGVDRAIGQVVAALKRHGIYDESLVLFASDHGEELWEHGGFEHGHTMYDEVLRVPLLVKLPGAAEGQRVEQTVSTASLTPTVLDVLGIDPAGAPFSSPSLRPLWEGGPAPEDTMFVASGTFYYGQRVAVVKDGLKYVLDLDSGAEELFDLALDPGETRSLTRERPDDVEALRAAFDAFRAECAELRSELGLRDDTAELDRSVLEALRRVGYAGGD
jgi:arylsulfatase A-like enzyme